VIFSVPEGRELTEICAWPPETAALPKFEPFCENCTVPVTAGPPFAVAVTIAVNVTLDPCWMLPFDDLTVALVCPSTCTTAAADVELL
jgi:hypothetical protein